MAVKQTNKHYLHTDVWHCDKCVSGGRGRRTEYKIVKEVEGDLFTAPKEWSLAHCVATDMRMGSGIAVSFR